MLQGNVCVLFSKGWGLWEKVRFQAPGRKSVCMITNYILFTLCSTFDGVEIHPSAQLNVIVGPNGEFGVIYGPRVLCAR